MLSEMMTEDTDTDQLEILIARGREALQRRDYKQAEKLLQTVLDKDPNNKDAARFMRFVMVAQKRTDGTSPDPAASNKRTLPPGGFKVLRNPRKKRKSSPDDEES